MYVFISYSSKDKEFVRYLADSLALYSIPIFLDERVIQIGDSIPESIYDGLERATHVVYVVSQHSVVSKWVQEELSIAKTRQMTQKGCRVLPVLIDNVDLPSSISHLKYADFRNWTLREAYFQTLRDLLGVLGTDLLSQASSQEAKFFLRHLGNLLRIKAFADSVSQVYFQIERLWFYLFKEQPGKAVWWFEETVRKSCGYAEYVGSWEAIAEDPLVLALSNSKHWEKLSTLYLKVRQEFEYFKGPANKESPDDIYQHIHKAEENADQLSAEILAIVLEVRHSFAELDEGGSVKRSQRFATPSSTHSD
jgi:hypothetical protein